MAETLDELDALIREAIKFHIEELREQGFPVPEPISTVDYVQAAAS